MVDPAPQASDVTRRTWLAAERTWPFKALGLGYGLLSVGVLAIGGLRQQRAAEALRRGSFEPLSSPLVAWLAGLAIALSVASMVLVVTAF
jgi:hypothetical protein